ncbi:hypothetical protein HPC62_07150 [Thermoleptolyngbya sichuanensis A183]|uniref:Uncharacterized protein n=1 Tax=Thermoleptolyngbya sichuanensis A183 TaxID=2737172 RepID=A0A6M8BB11_9CYAN|nr:hypothetical protein [Thermoleptolyngbya sp. PKUAC-SCTB121]QKD82007.1 hypothetical protein HPC62_07150 [Thermoleptolyngbya sichuanensis A183]
MEGFIAGHINHQIVLQIEPRLSQTLRTCYGAIGVDSIGVDFGLLVGAGLLAVRS